MSARWITSGTDGNLWVADFGGNQVVRVTTAGAGTTFAIGGGSQGIAAGPNGQVAFSQQGTAPTYIGRLTPPGAVEKTPAAGADPFGVAFGPDGAYWIAQFQTNNLVRLTTDGQATTLALPNLSGPRHLAAGPNNTLWVTLDTAEKVARVTGVAPPAPPDSEPSPTPTPNPAVDTQITKAPKKVVRTAKPRAKVKVRFTGTAGATFECRLAKKPRKPAGGEVAGMCIAQGLPPAAGSVSVRRPRRHRSGQGRLPGQSPVPGGAQVGSELRYVAGLG